MAEVLTLRENELCSLKEKLENLRTQRSVILANEDVKNGGKGMKAEAALRYFDSKLLANRETYQTRLETLDKEHQTKLAILEARRQQIDMEIDKLNGTIDRKKSEAERTYLNYEEYLKDGMATKKEEVNRQTEVKSAATIALDRQIRELEQQLIPAAWLVDETRNQIAKNNRSTKPTTMEEILEEARRPPVVFKEEDYYNIMSPEDLEIAKMRAEAKREERDRKTLRESPYGPMDREYRKFA